MAAWALRRCAAVVAAAGESARGPGGWLAGWPGAGGGPARMPARHPPPPLNPPLVPAGLLRPLRPPALCGARALALCRLPAPPGPPARLLAPQLRPILGR